MQPKKKKKPAAKTVRGFVYSSYGLQQGILKQLGEPTP